MNAQQLKDSILQYAVQGKLVSQNSNDESSAILFEQIQKEKEQLVLDQVIKKEKTLSKVAEEEIPFELPDSWSWVRLGEITKFIDYRGKTPIKTTSGIRLITAKNIKKGFLSKMPEEFISVDDYDSWMTRGIPENGDLLFTTEAPLGNVALIDINERFALAQRAIAMKFINCNSSYFLYCLLSAPIQKLIKNKATGTTAQGIKASKLKEIIVPLPPLQEQGRIVKKIEELLPKVELFDLNEKELNKLQINFPSKLENSILHFAMQGKLVEQDPNDKPATELIEHIRREKEILIKEKVLKKEKELAPISAEEVPFDIPENWAWVRIKDITNFGNASTINPEKINAKDWVLDLEEIEKNTGQIINVKLAKEKPVKSNKYKFSENEVLYGKLRPYLNKVAIAPKDGYCTTEIIPLKIYGNINVRYMQLALMSPYFIEYANSCSYGVKMPRLGTQQIANALIPLPPLKEQKRIVNKIEESFHTAEKLK